jgi:hypothetical protein
MTDGARRIAEVIGAVARQALVDRGRTRIALLDDGSPEAGLATRMLADQLGEERIVLVTATDADAAPLVRVADADPRRVEDEVRRLLARLVHDALPAHPANKTALLLGGGLPPEPLLPLGDLWATDVRALAGGWSAPPEVLALAEEAGGIEALDGVLRRLIDGRDAAAVDPLPPALAERVREMLAAGSGSRRYPQIVPKLGGRTLFGDLYE